MSSSSQKHSSGFNVILFLLCCFIGLPAIGCWYYLAGPGYLEEVNFIRKQLNAIPGVEVVDMKWSDDLRPESIRAKIKIEDKGTMLIAGLKKKTFTQPSGIHLSGIGEFEFNVSGECYSMQHPVGKPFEVRPVKTEFWSGVLSTGEKGQFSHLFPFRLDSVQDAVKHYTEIFDIVSKWPQSPEKGHFKDEDGLKVYYWLAPMTGA